MASRPRAGFRGLAESYVDGWWDTDDLTALLRVASRRTTPLRERLDAWARTAGPLLAAMKWRRTPSKSDDRRNIASHYDLSNDLFALMLDPTMAYSCAYFSEEDTTLEQAQVAKFERIAFKLGLGPEDHVVEIGTGWGDSPSTPPNATAAASPRPRSLRHSDRMPRSASRNTASPTG